jgi:hydroxypyruvate reductase
VKPLNILHTDAEKIMTAGLKAVDPEKAVRRHVRRRGSLLEAGGRTFDLDSVRDVWILGAGKAAASMGKSLERVLGSRLSGGFLVTKYGHGLPSKRLDIMEAGHPLPDANSVAAGRRLALLAERIAPGDLVFCLLSGGASSLLVSPAEGISLEDKVSCTREMMAAGASIRELNAVRKHLSAIKGGGVARLLKGASLVSLVLSDVVGDDRETIASGPTVADETTFSDCVDVVRRLGLLKKVPGAVLNRFREGAAGRIADTPGRGDPLFRGNEYIVIGNIAAACTAAAHAARRMGYHSIVLASGLEGDTGAAAGFHMGVMEEIVALNRPARRPACVISGG